MLGERRGEDLEGELVFDADGLRHGEERRQGPFDDVPDGTPDGQHGGDGNRITETHTLTDLRGCPRIRSLTPGNVVT
ncbi:hypothetical protein [Methylobacterium fujisawaense]|uniref:hypothetical protein n=1 Tax=Methylobacterium fujisawaense TaxID=107400 RepID=UPI00244A0CB1|nr:hypothetical protein [Methylobacterium fujisawaense]MDH3029029.1 hypothetical protein [Methylobacterium fujisawaense]